MDEPISATKANRNFSAILRNVREGRSYLVTSHGRPVARIVRAGRQRNLTARMRDALLARLEGQPPVDMGRWRRDELYERT